MGEIYKFTCPKCGYSAKVSGDVDCGYIVVTTAILCKECKRLYDVEIGKALEDKEPFKDPVCPRQRQHTVRSWKYPDVCLKCSTQMEKGDGVMLWD